MNKSLVEKTQKLFSKKYGRPVSEDEAKEIGRNLGKLGQIVLRQAKERETA